MSDSNKVFTIDRSLRGGGTDIQLTVHGPDDDSCVLALANNTQFPDGKLGLGSINLAASSGTSIPFAAADGSNKVTFKANADGFFSAGIYLDPADLLQDLSPEDNIAAGLNLTAHHDSRFLMLRCGYDLGGTVKGSVGLGTGLSANFGGSAHRDAMYAVIHEFSNSEGAHDILDSAIQSWILPTQFGVSTADGTFRVKPRTWIVTEVDGNVAFNLGVQAGYDYSWLRQFPDGALKGDLGLKIQLAANAALGFSANGSFAMALSRESAAPVFRLRLYKLSKNDWAFAFNASAGEQATLPDVFQQNKNIDDLISAVFGLHTAQLAQDLTDPKITSAASVAKFIEHRGTKEFADLTGVTPDQLFAAGKAKVDEFLSDWKALTHKPATMLAAILKRNRNVDALTDFLRKIEALDSGPEIKALLTESLEQADFFQTSVGQFIDSTVLTTPLGAILSGIEWQNIKVLAGKTLDILNAGTLKSLIDYANEHFDLDAVASVKNEGDASNLDPWLQNKIVTFLGKDPTATLVLADVRKAQIVLKALKDNAGKFYDLARQAIQKNYEIAFTSLYQRSATTTALLDASFDLSAIPSPLEFLKRAINGDMRQILLQKFNGITLGAATLTHDINRQSHSDITMPFIDISTDDVSDSIASVSPEEHDGRVLMYRIDAQDEVKHHTGFFSAKSASDSKLALVATIPVRPGETGVTQFSKPYVSYGYTLAKAASAMGTAQLLNDLTPLVNEYMPGIFKRKPLGDWVAAVDSQVDTLHAGVLGETVFTFDVSLPPEAFQSWFDAPPNDKDVRYFFLSKALQTRLRQMIPFYYFQDPGRYDGGIEADVVMAYGAMPASNGFEITVDSKIGKQQNEIYFDLDGTRAIQALIDSQAFATNLAKAMQTAFAVTKGASVKTSKFYLFNQENVNRVVKSALKKPSETALLPGILGPLFLFELNLIRAAVHAAVRLSNFRVTAATDPSGAIKHLASFGDEFVQTFNNHLGGNLVAGRYLRGLGSALFVETARALAQGASPGKPAAFFRMSVLESNPSLNVDQMLAGDLGSAKVLTRQTLVSL